MPAGPLHQSQSQEANFMKYIVTMNGKQYEVEVEGMSAFHMLTRQEIASGVSTPVVPVTAPVPVAAAPVAAAPAPKAAPAPAGGAGALTAPMPGTVLDIKVAEGAAVTAGQVVLILEAMKMENEITAPADGTVASIPVAKGASVNSGDTLMTFN